MSKLHASLTPFAGLISNDVSTFTSTPAYGRYRNSFLKCGASKEARASMTGRDACPTVRNHLMERRRYLIARALGGEPTPPGMLSGAEARKKV
jgi:hypothetical protein